MACGVPCVVTDVGDSAAIVGGLGEVVPPKSPEALKSAWERLLDLGPEAYTRLALACRERICREFGARQLVEKTETLLCALLGGAG